MTPESVTQTVIVLLTATLVASAAGWARFGRTVWPPIAVGLLAGTAVFTAVADRLDTSSSAVTTTVVVLAGLAAVLGGGPITTRVFTAVDATQGPEGPEGPLSSPVSPLA